MNGRVCWLMAWLPRSRKTIDSEFETFFILPAGSSRGETTTGADRTGREMPSQAGQIEKRRTG